jgi:hypothetical protein
MTESFCVARVEGSKIKSTSLEMTITRADGRIEHLGTVQYWHANPLMRLIWRVRKVLGIMPAPSQAHMQAVSKVGDK